ncbi:MAG: site-specific DNA-methyltransferase [Bacteroidaceae bacterium]|nr:site-specific DNA-methyltransferase [Bacteroidaceae bacterium]
MERLKLQTTDMAERNVELLGQMFPNCLTETINADGKLVRAIDFDKLRQELACEVVEGAEERYQFTWPDKRAAIRLANAPTNKTLRPCREESVDFDNTENLYIEGDNLEVLKLLRENYLGKVKMIYIDPPYNTGNDFVYNDDFAQGKAEFEAQSGLFDEEGRRMADPMVQNTESNGRFHTDWLNMIYPRLKVAKDLLSDDGVIFISIDDNEVRNLRNVCDEVFGEQNFIANLIWQKKFSRANDAKYFSTMHDHILCYCKVNIYASDNGWQIGLLPRGEEIPSGYTNPDNDPRGVWTSVILSAKSGSESLVYEIETPSGRKVLPPSGRYWCCNKETFTKWKNDGRIWFGADGNGTPRKKTFLSEVQDGLRPNTIILHSEGGHNQEGKQEMKALFDDIGVFDGPKPIRLLRYLSTIANLNEDSIVLDFFSGSATTAHAVMQLNAEDGGNRRFIMVQLPEKTDEKSEAYKAGYKNICEIGKERIRRAGKKIKEENASKEGIERLDVGFRVLKLDESNMADVYYTPAETPIQTTLAFDALVDNIREGRTAEDLLFQVLPECNLPLSSKIETREIHGKKVFVVEDGYLMACFDKDINEAVITAIAKEKPYYFVMCDRSIATDNVADNFDQIFNAYSKETVRRIL